MTIAEPLPEPPGPVVSGDLADYDELLEGSAPEARSQWQLFRRKFLRHRAAMAGLVVLVLLCVCCFGASWVAPFPKNAQNLLVDSSGPSWDHLFGVDQLGRDYLTEVLYGGQISLSIGLVTRTLCG